MFKTIEAVVETDGSVRLLEKISLDKSHKALVTILDNGYDTLSSRVSETALLSEQALAVDWNRPEEDEAWAHLQRPK